jgi:molybdopterin synthase sulfur carrier subunit
MVRVRFSAALNSVTKERETTIDLQEDITVKELINKLVDKYGEGLEKRLLEKGEIRRFVNFYVNGDDIRHSGGLDAPIKNDDEVSILPAVSGG